MGFPLYIINWFFLLLLLGFSLYPYIIIKMINFILAWFSLGSSYFELSGLPGAGYLFSPRLVKFSAIISCGFLICASTSSSLLLNLKCIFQLSYNQFGTFLYFVCLWSYHCSSILLLRPVSTFMTITLNPLLGRFFICILLRSFSGDLSCSLEYFPLSGHFAWLSVFVYVY